MLRKSKSPPDAPPDTMLQRVTDWSVRHRATALIGWLVLVLVTVLAGALVPGRPASPDDPGEAGRARRVVDTQAGFEPLQESVLVQAPHTDVPSGPTLRQVTEELVAALGRLPGVAGSVRSPLDPDNADRISADGRSWLVTFEVNGTPEERVPRFDTAITTVTAVARRHPEATLLHTGDRSLSQAVDQRIKEDFSASHNLALPLTLLVLLVVFGSLVAASIPLLLTLTVVVSTFSLLQVVDRFTPVNSAASSMVLLVAMAVGVDYCLFSLRRVREERAAGRDLVEALRVTARTSGRVVVVSAVTVAACLSGLVLTGISVFRGATIGIALAVLLAALGAVTALPALLALLGDAVERARVPWLGRRRTTAAPSRFWTGLAARVVRAPLFWGGLAAVLLGGLALPALHLRPQDAAPTNSLPRTVSAVDAAIRVQEQFPGAASPARVVVWATDGTTVGSRPDVVAAVTTLRGQVANHRLPGLSGPLTVAAVDRVLVLRIPLAGSGTDTTSTRALRVLRQQVLPAVLGPLAGVGYAVMGRTAFATDFAQRLHSRTPVVVVFVLVLAFALLVGAFRTVAVPLVSVALNLLSVAAAYGVLTWVFQDGHLAGVLGFTPYGGVVGWLPLFMFVLLFGLSMDYHLFILSRIRERWAAGDNARTAVVAGTGASAGVVTSAATIMVCVFGVFLALGAIENKMLGLGMAVAVVLDATVVRGVLLPAALALLGERAWKTPALLGRLPARLTH